jgi:hypothetical protein
MIHLGKNTRSTILSKGISAGHGQNSYRGLVKVMKGAADARNYTQCDSLLIGDRCGRPHLPVHGSALTARPRSSTKPRPRRSAMISSSIASNAASRWKTRCR